MAPGTRSKLGVFESKFVALKKVPVTLLGLFGAQGIVPPLLRAWLVRQAGPDFPIGYVGLGPQDPRGLQQTVVRIESVFCM